MDFFKRIFGIPNDDNFDRFPRNNAEPDMKTFFNRSEPPREEFPRKGFDMFNDPFQMQQYFEHEMNEMLKIFGFQGFVDHSNVPRLEDPRANIDDTPNSSLRDQFLKNGYEHPSKGDSDRADHDLDAKVKSGNLDAILSREYDDKVSPFKNPQSRNFFYGTSHTMRTITNPDGSVETHHTTRDNDGNEETTICHTIGEKEYCLVKKKDKSGKEEVTEQFINMNESEKDMFLKSGQPTLDSGSEKRFPFDKFFK